MRRTIVLLLLATFAYGSDKVTLAPSPFNSVQNPGIPQFTPDGKTVYFTGNSRFSPDGKYLYFTSNRGGKGQVYQVEATLLSELAGQEAHP